MWVVGLAAMSECGRVGEWAVSMVYERVDQLADKRVEWWAAGMVAATDERSVDTMAEKMAAGKVGSMDVETVVWKVFARVAKMVGW